MHHSPSTMVRCAVVGASLVVLAGVPARVRAQQAGATSDFWAARDVVIEAGPGVAPVRIAIWDSGVDTTLFRRRLARNRDGRPFVRGYDAFKRRQDVPMEMLPDELQSRRDEMNAALQAFDDLDGGVDSPRARAIDARMRAMSKEEQRAFDEQLGRWSGYVHGTNVADVALAGHATAEIVIARMEWWHGSPPVPCWSRELADREAASIGDLLEFVVRSGARVVNMSWGRFEASYVRNLEQCAPTLPAAERLALARYTVDTIRRVLVAGMKAAPQVLFVGAAGNASGTVAAANPATRFYLPNFLLVGAVDRAGVPARFTNTGPEVMLYANGERVPARLPGGAPSFPSGTSLAAPIVSGAAAKVLAVDTTLSGAALRALLLESADTNATGQRLLHPARAVERARAGVRAGAAGSRAP